ncbi:Biofilm dispersion protein BdlA [Posidoniimonas polymericola]|uniref:histidine kinase n=1 Tax=Posidoniimonas polymericola TaxID=2528002 RepID=A0A5C5ZFK9_9BACT|nr:PAS domain-containing sensor histidine kinase [Posidoniimonas polymericola]TWT85343.1 Biofilm dispersion protein BdlA [Posidoniimonas polymericola]
MQHPSAKTTATDLAVLHREIATIRAQLSAIDRSHGRIEFSTQGIILEVNQNYLDMMGYHRGELLGRHHRLFVPEADHDSPDYAEFWRRLHDGTFQRGEFMRLAHDGSQRWIQATYNPVCCPEGRVERVVKYAIDITPQKRAEQVAERASLLLDAQLAAIDRSQCRVEFSADGTILDVNDNFVQMMGYRREELLGRHHRIMMPDGGYDPVEYEAFWELLRGGHFHRDEFMRIARDGSQRWMQATYTPFCLSDGRVERVVKYAIDITDRKKLEARNSRRERLESIGALATGVAHEINSPLQCILGVLNYLNASYARQADASGTLKPAGLAGWVRDHREAIDDAIDAAEKAAGITAAMRVFSLPSTPGRQEFGLGEAVDIAIKLTRNATAGVAAVAIDGESLSHRMVGYEGEICQVMVNLIANAVDAIQERPGSERGGAQIRIEGRRLPDGGLEVVCADTGVGMEPDVVTRAFDRFFTTKDTGGVGLGLWLCYDVVVNRHGGQIRIDSEPGRGAVFTLWFPPSCLVDGDRHVDENPRSADLSPAR